MDMLRYRVRRVSRFVPTIALLLPLAGSLDACSDAAAPMPTAQSPSSPNLGKNVSGSNQRILFSSDRDGTSLEIYSVKPDGTDPKRLTNAPGTDRLAVWSPDGKRIAFVSNRDNPLGEIYVMNADGTEVVRLTNGTASNVSPGWSKDGKQIAFASNRDAADPAVARGPDFEIYVMNADGSQVVRLTNDNTFDGQPTFSSDGRQIAFVSTRDQPVFGTELYVMQTDGTGVSRLTFQDGTLDYPSWDPHSRRLAFSVSNSSGSDGVYTLNLDNSGLTRLTFGATTSDGLPSWSTDGSQIVFQSRRDGNVQLYVMNADGTEQTRLMVSNRADEFPRWSR